MSNDEMLPQFPPLPPEELEHALTFHNVVRVVVTQNGVYGQNKRGSWVEFKPLATLLSTESSQNG